MTGFRYLALRESLGDRHRAARVLGWRTYGATGRVLLGDARDVATVSRWATGRRRVPGWVARDLRADLGLSPEDPWPSGLTRHELVLADWSEDPGL